MRQIAFVAGYFLFCSAVLLLGPRAAHATHFRYGHYTWQQQSGNTVEMVVQNAFRRDDYFCIDPATLVSAPCSSADGLPSTGDVIPEFIGGTIVHWGDGTTISSPLGVLLYRVTSVDPNENWFLGRALDPRALPDVDTTLSHEYDAPGNYLVFTESCCRISRIAPPNEHINNPDNTYRVETLVTVGLENSAPVSALPPIVRCPIDSVCRFVVPGSDPDGDDVSFRLSSPTEASSAGEFLQPGPPYAPNPAIVDATTGEFTWDTTGATLAGDSTNDTLYSAQVTLEDGLSKSAVDFLISLVEQDPNPPVVEPPPDSPPICETTHVVAVGDTKTFDVTAADPDPGDLVTLNSSGLPEPAVMIPALPLSGNPVVSTFSWTPVEEDAGTHVVNFTASSTGGGQALCPVTLSVEETCESLSVDAGPDRTVQSGESIQFSIDNNTCSASFDLVKWDFSDGVVTQSDSVNHRFSMPGTYEVSVMVTDDSGQSTVDTALVQVTELTATLEFSDIDFLGRRHHATAAVNYYWQGDFANGPLYFATNISLESNLILTDVALLSSSDDFFELPGLFSCTWQNWLVWKIAGGPPKEREKSWEIGVDFQKMTLLVRTLYLTSTFSTGGFPIIPPLNSGCVHRSIP